MLCFSDGGARGVFKVLGHIVMFKYNQSIPTKTFQCVQKHKSVFNTSINMVTFDKCLQRISKWLILTLQGEGFNFLLTVEWKRIWPSELGFCANRVRFIFFLNPLLYSQVPANSKGYRFLPNLASRLRCPDTVNEQEPSHWGMGSFKAFCCQCLNLLPFSFYKVVSLN